MEIDNELSLAPAELQNLAAECVRVARAQSGVSAAVGRVSESRALEVGCRRGAIESTSFSRERGISITVYCGQKKGSADASDISPAAIAAVAEKAATIARASATDRFFGLPDKSWLAQSFPALDLYHPESPLASDPAAALAATCAAEEASWAADARVDRDKSEGATCWASAGRGRFRRQRRLLRRAPKHALRPFVRRHRGRRRRNGARRLGFSGARRIRPATAGRDRPRSRIARGAAARREARPRRRMAGFVRVSGFAFARRPHRRRRFGRAAVSEIEFFARHARRANRRCGVVGARRAVRAARPFFRRLRRRRSRRPRPPDRRARDFARLFFGLLQRAPLGRGIDGQRQRLPQHRRRRRPASADIRRNAGRYAARLRRHGN